MITAGERLDLRRRRLPAPAARRCRAGIRWRRPPDARSTWPPSGPPTSRLTGELADGWIGNSFFPETADVFLEPIRAGRGAAGRTLDDLDLVVAVGLEFTDDDRRRGRPSPRRRLRVHVRGHGGARRTSTTTPSPARATATTCARCSACGWPATGRPPRRGSRSRSASAPTSSAPPDDRRAPRRLRAQRRHHAAGQARRRRPEVADLESLLATRGTCRRADRHRTSPRPSPRSHDDRHDGPPMPPR